MPISGPPGDRDHTPEPGGEWLAPAPPRPVPSRRRWLARAAASCVTPLLARPAHAAQVQPWATGRPTPPFALTDLDDRRWTLPALAGRPVLLNFWASWCPPCRNEMSSLELLQTRHERAGLVVLAVDVEEPVATIRRFLDIQPVLLPVLPDLQGEATRAWTARRFPTSVLIDRRGRPRTTVTGELDWMAAEAAALLEPLIR